MKKVFSKEKLVSQRKKKHMTQMDLASAMNVSCALVSSWEMVKQYPMTLIFNSYVLVKERPIRTLLKVSAGYSRSRYGDCCDGVQSPTFVNIE